MITNEAWAEGLADLVACCSSAELTPEMAMHRGRCYRQDLAYLSDERWLYAVSIARRKAWFPSIEQLEQYAAEMPPPPVKGLLQAAPCEACRGTGYEATEVDGVRFVRRCACRPVQGVQTA